MLTKLRINSVHIRLTKTCMNIYIYIYSVSVQWYLIWKPIWQNKFDYEIEDVTIDRDELLWRLASMDVESKFIAFKEKNREFKKHQVY